MYEVGLEAAGVEIKVELELGLGVAVEFYERIVTMFLLGSRMFVYDSARGEFDDFVLDLVGSYD